MNYESYRVVEKSPCGRYIRYNHKLGGGASKQVYIGWDRVEKLELAWNKIVFRDEDEKLFDDEATLLKSLYHERVMKCFSYWFDFESKTMNMITELFPSGSLKNYLDNGDNLFVNDNGKQVKPGDFGLFVRIKEGKFVKEAKGTPEFMAPECYDGEYNELVDVYSFGMCLLEMVTGEYPYMECNNHVQIFKKVYAGVKPVSLGKVQDSRLKEIIEKCMLPMSAAKELLKDPFFLCNGGSSSTSEARAPTTVSSTTSHPFKGCARVVVWTLKKYQQMQAKFSKSRIFSTRVQLQK